VTLSVSDTFSQFKLVKYSRAGTVYSFKWQTSQISDSPAWSLTCPDWGNLNQGPPAGASTTFLPPPSHCIMWGNTQDSLLAPSLPFPLDTTLFLLCPTGMRTLEWQEGFGRYETALKSVYKNSNYRCVLEGVSAHLGRCHQKPFIYLATSAETPIYRCVVVYIAA